MLAASDKADMGSSTISAPEHLGRPWKELYPCPLIEIQQSWIDGQEISREKEKAAIEGGCEMRLNCLRWEEVAREVGAAVTRAASQQATGSPDWADHRQKSLSKSLHWCHQEFAKFVSSQVQPNVEILWVLQYRKQMLELLHC
jgi:hypothetical protein